MTNSCDLLSFFEILIFTTTPGHTYKEAYSCDLLSFFEILIFTTTFVRKNIQFALL